MERKAEVHSVAGKEIQVPEGEVYPGQEEEEMADWAVEASLE